VAVTEEYVQGIARRLEMKGFDVKDGDLPADFRLVGYRSQFRLRWLAKINLFAVVTETQVATASTVEGYTKRALDYGIAQKGRFRGLQNGVAVISVVVANAADQGAITSAKTYLTRRPGAFAWPVLVDMSSGIRYRHEGRVLIGGFFANWMREQIDDVVPEPQRSVS
jgi:hypothetical protein